MCDALPDLDFSEVSFPDVKLKVEVKEDAHDDCFTDYSKNDVSATVHRSLQTPESELRMMIPVTRGKRGRKRKADLARYPLQFLQKLLVQNLVDEVQAAEVGVDDLLNTVVIVHLTHPGLGLLLFHHLIFPMIQLLRIHGNIGKRVRMVVKHHFKIIHKLII